MPPTATKDCPITDVKFIGASSEPTYVAEGYTIVTIESDPYMLIAYHKDTDSLPPTTIRIEQQPCINPYD